MQINGVILIKDHFLECKDKALIDYNDLILNRLFYQLIVAYMSNGSYVDINKLYDAQTHLNDSMTNWDDLETYISNLDFIDIYSSSTPVPRNMFVQGPTVNNAPTTKITTTPFGSNQKEQLKIISAENEFLIKVDFGSHRHPYLRNTDLPISEFPDIVVTKTGNSITLENSIIIADGVVCYCEEWNNRLYAHNANLALRNTKTYNKNILLVDFTPIGNTTKVKLSDCIDTQITSNVIENLHATPIKQFEYSEYQQMVVETENIHVATSAGTNYNIAFTVPNYNKNCVPVLVVAGRMFFPTDGLKIHNVDGGKRVSFDINRYALAHMVIYNLLRFNKMKKNTSIIEYSLQSFLDNLFVDKNVTSFTGTPEEINEQRFSEGLIPFIILVETDKKLTVSRTPIWTVLKPDKLKFVPNAGGLLWNKKTREIVDYVKLPYNSSTIITTLERSNLKMLFNDNFNNLNSDTIGFSSVDTVGIDKYNKFSQYNNLSNLEDYELIDIIPY